MAKMAMPALPARPRAPALVADLADLFRSLPSLIDPYRPELHYMRGPGPKWHAKHDRVPAAIDAMPDLATLRGKG